jgi:dTDP-4-amino-4,6-dideoxygalactose transaminase
VTAAITTANAEWDRHCLLRQHSMSVPDTARHNRKEVIESYLTVGYNYRMTDIQAAVGREQLKRLPEMIAQRRLLAQRYRELEKVPALRRRTNRSGRAAMAELLRWIGRRPDQRVIMQKCLTQTCPPGAASARIESRLIKYSRGRG